MAQISRNSLWTLEHYARERVAFRQRVMEHKKNRRMFLGDHIALAFEDELTIRYQVQEMLRIEKIFEEAGIQDELDAYTPLIPDGRNFKATMLIEYEDPIERARELARLRGVEGKVWLRVESSPKVYAIADEDLERENDEKTSAVHFVRFELTEDMAKALKYGVSLAAGVDHDAYRVTLDPVPANVRDALVRDLR